MSNMKIAVIMDPIEQIKPHKDTSFAMMLEAQRRDYEVYYILQQDMSLHGNQALAKGVKLSLQDSSSDWYKKTSEPIEIELSQMDFILMRKDPPLDMNYLYATHILELASKQGKKPIVVNRPQSLRDANEKLFILNFPACIAPTLVSADATRVKAFQQQYLDIILKPLDGMGGTSIFRLKANDSNTNVIIETMTQQGQNMIMAQQFLPEIKQGDKRIILINGEPIDYALARIPAVGENRGNLASGGVGKGVPLNTRDYYLCEKVKPLLQEKGLIFVGLDVIGDYITEINVTSPTCVRELDAQFGLNICAQLFDYLESLR